MMEIICLSGCSLVALVVLYLTAVKSNRILFSDGEKHYYPLISAGSTEKNKKAANVSILGTNFHSNGEKIDTDPYKKFVVDGWSMQKFGIKSGDIVLVDEQYETSDLFKKTNPIIALKIQPEEKVKIEYKLRKFIDFYDFEKNNDFKHWIEEKHPGLASEELYNKYNEKKTEDKIKVCKERNCRLVFSETSRKKGYFSIKRSIYYSFHPEDSIMGIVKYKIPKGSVYIFDKV